MRKLLDGVGTGTKATDVDAFVAGLSGMSKTELDALLPQVKISGKAGSKAEAIARVKAVLTQQMDMSAKTQGFDITNPRPQDWRSMAKEYRQGGVIDAPEAKRLRARYDTLAQGEKNQFAENFGIMGASSALPEVRDNLVHRKITDMEFRGRGDGPPIHQEQKNKLFGTPGVGESEDLFGGEEAGSQWEPGAIKDLIKDAPNRYSGADKKSLRPIIDKDTHYLGNMDLGLLKEPAKEAGVQIAREHDAEKVRSLIRDKIEDAVSGSAGASQTSHTPESVHREVKSVIERMKTDPSIGIQQVSDHFKKFESMSMADLHSVMKLIGMKVPPKSQSDALSKIKNHVVAVQAAFERSDA